MIPKKALWDAEKRIAKLEALNAKLLAALIKCNELIGDQDLWGLDTTIVLCDEVHAAIADAKEGDNA